MSALISVIESSSKLVSRRGSGNKAVVPAGPETTFEEIGKTILPRLVLLPRVLDGLDRLCERGIVGVEVEVEEEEVGEQGFAEVFRRSIFDSGWVFVM